MTKQPTTTQNDPRWQAVVARDGSQDGKFVYSVQSTGVYCRPSCAARLAKPENVRFHATCEAAERAGFRPCKRCKPNQPSLSQQHAETIAQICRYLENTDATPSLAELSCQAGLSPHHFHRTFKAITGVTPRAYAQAHRASRMQQALTQTDASVTSAIHDAGFNSSSRFYENSNDILGMTPTDYRRGGASTTIYFAIAECSLGSILVAQSAKGICAIFLGNEAEPLLQDLQERFPQAHLIGGDSHFEKTVAQVIGFIENPTTTFDLPLDVRGTAFQQRVWQALRQIPIGTTATYQDIAKLIGSPKAVRAVAGACAANKIAVAIPCHRVVRSDGNLSGYRWGVERKRKLLKREASP